LVNKHQAETVIKSAVYGEFYLLTASFKVAAGFFRLRANRDKNAAFRKHLAELNQAAT
jgi:hypothetical protein